MSTYSSIKRFLAGAICPRCEATDTIMVYSREERDFRECAECGFLDEMHFTPQAKDVDTRVSDTTANKTEEQVVKIMPSPADKTS